MNAQQHINRIFLHSIPQLLQTWSSMFFFSNSVNETVGIEIQSNTIDLIRCSSITNQQQSIIISLTKTLNMASEPIRLNGDLDRWMIISYEYFEIVKAF